MCGRSQGTTGSVGKYKSGDCIMGSAAGQDEGVRPGAAVRHGSYVDVPCRGQIRKGRTRT